MAPFANTEAAVDLVSGIANNLGILYAGTKHLDRLNSQKTQQIAGNFVQTMWPILNALVKGFFNYSNILRSSFDLMSQCPLLWSGGNGGAACRVNGALKEAYKHHVSHHEITTAVTLLEQFHKTHSQVFVDFYYMCVSIQTAKCLPMSTLTHRS